MSLNQIASLSDPANMKKSDAEDPFAEYRDKDIATGLEMTFGANTVKEMSGNELQVASVLVATQIELDS